MPTHRIHSLLSVENLWIEFPESEQPVLRGVNLELKTGECFVIIGPGGQGKTVLLKTIAGLYPPMKGKVIFNGEELWSLKGANKRRLTRKISMSFQRSGLFDSLNAEHNLIFPLQEVLGLSDTEAHLKASQLLMRVGLSGQEEKFPHEMSGGMQKRLCIARAISLDPELILYDDPTAGLDPVTSLSILEVILDSQEKSGIGIILTTSDLDLALHMAKKRSARIGFLYQGSFLGIETLESLAVSNEPVLNQFISGALEGPLEQND